MPVDQAVEAVGLASIFSVAPPRTALPVTATLSLTPEASPRISTVAPGESVRLPVVNVPMTGTPFTAASERSPGRMNEPASAVTAPKNEPVPVSTPPLLFTVATVLDTDCDPSSFTVPELFSVIVPAP